MSIKYLNDAVLESVIGGNNAVTPTDPSTPANGQLLASVQLPATDLMDQGIVLGDYMSRFKLYDDPNGKYITKLLFS